MHPKSSNHSGFQTAYIVIGILIASILVAGSATLLKMEGKPVVDVPIPTLSLEEAYIPTLNLAARVVGKTSELDVHFFTPQEATVGFTAPKDEHVLFDCPIGTNASATMAHGDAQLFETARYWGYEYTGEELNNGNSGLTGLDMFNGRFWLSNGEMAATGSQYDYLNTVDMQMVAEKRYYLMTTIPLRVSCLDSDNDGLNDGREDLNSNDVVDTGETDKNTPDTDSGGVNDGQEILNGTDPTNPLDDSADVCGDGICDASESSESCSVDCSYDYMLTGVGYELVNHAFSPKLNYIGNSESSFEGRLFKMSLIIPGIDTYWFNSRYIKYHVDIDWYKFYLSDTELDKIFALYPDGIIPYEFVFKIAPDDGPYNEDTAILLNRATGSVQVSNFGDNHEFKIGFVQVVPPGFKLEDQNLCLRKDDTLGGAGYIPSGVYEDCAAKWDWGTNEQFISTRSYPLVDILYNQDPFVVIDDVTDKASEDLSGSIKTYSLNYIDDFWENLLQLHNIVDIKTRLKKNPSFEVIFLPPIEKDNTLKSSHHGQVKDFFRSAVSESNIDVGQFDFVIYALFIPESINEAHFTRSFAAGNNAYISFPIYNDKILFNEVFFSIVHELGHSIFGVNDLYNGFGIKYPEGVPNPNNFPQKNACIMAKNFGLKKISETKVQGYSTIYDNESLQDLNLNRFHTKDPNNFVLCADTIVEIIKGYENPNCLLSEFYNGDCGNCTSLDYLSCGKDHLQ